jgi:dTMP kinase
VSGLFITFEGGDGSGKSTQVSLLSRWLTEQGYTTLETREPGGTEVGVELRNIILHRKGFLAPRAEALLYAADRAHHVFTVVRPALEAGTIVVQDRYLDSSVAYQGAGRVLEENEVRDVSLWATENLLPDLTIVLDAPAATLRARIQGDNRVYDRLEAEGDEFHERVREAYRRFAAHDPDRLHILDATLPVEDIHQLVTSLVAKRLS